MSSPSSWPSPSGPPNPDLHKQGATQPLPQGYGATQPMPVAQPYGGAPGYPGYPGGAVPVGYGGGLPVPAPAPRPERPLLPGVWWSLLYNAIVTVLTGLAILALGAFIISIVTGASGSDATWSEAFGTEGTGVVVAIAVGALLVGLLLSWALTVICLVLWRLVRGYRTLPPAVQALLALLTSWVVGWILSFVLQLVGAFAGVLGSGAATSSF